MCTCIAELLEKAATEMGGDMIRLETKRNRNKDTWIYRTPATAELLSYRLIRASYIYQDLTHEKFSSDVAKI